MKTTFTFENKDIEQLIKNYLFIKNYKPTKFNVLCNEDTNVLTISVECEEIPKSTSCMDR